MSSSTSTSTPPSSAKRTKVVVIGGTGQVGQRLVDFLEKRECDVVVAAPSKGINAQTGDGLEEAMKGAEVLVDVSNITKWDSEEALKFFTDVTNHCIKFGHRLRHYIALSIVGTDKMAADNVYMKAKLDQEQLVASSGLPYTIVRATQFFEFTAGIVEASGFKVPTALYQPMAIADVATLLGDIALGAPRNGIVEIAGPESLPMDEVAKDYFKARGDSYKGTQHEVISSPGAKYVGSIPFDDGTLRPSQPNPMLGSTKYRDWLKSQA